MGWASTLQLCNLVLVPIFATILVEVERFHAVDRHTIGISMCGIACLFALPVVCKWELGGYCQAVEEAKLGTALLWPCSHFRRYGTSGHAQPASSCGGALLSNRFG